MRAYSFDPLDRRVQDALRAWGTPYSYGAGIPSVLGWPDGVPGIRKGQGYDCSGLVQVLLVRNGVLSEGEMDRTAQSLFALALPLALGEPAGFGDLAFYGADETRITHVTFLLSSSACIGANGGSSKTNADDPKAFVQIQPIRYRSDFRGVRRVKYVPRKA